MGLVTITNCIHTNRWTDNYNQTNFRCTIKINVGLAHARPQLVLHQEQFLMSLSLCGVINQHLLVSSLYVWFIYNGNLEMTSISSLTERALLPVHKDTSCSITSLVPRPGPFNVACRKEGRPERGNHVSAIA